MDATDLNKFVACVYKWLGGTCYKERMNNIVFIHGAYHRSQ